MLCDGFVTLMSRVINPFLTVSASLRTSFCLHCYDLGITSSFPGWGSSKTDYVDFEVTRYVFDLILSLSETFLFFLTQSVFFLLQDFHSTCPHSVSLKTSIAIKSNVDANPGFSSGERVSRVLIQASFMMGTYAQHLWDTRWITGWLLLISFLFNISVLYYIFFYLMDCEMLQFRIGFRACTNETWGRISA